MTIEQLRKIREGVFVRASDAFSSGDSQMAAWFHEYRMELAHRILKQLCIIARDPHDPEGFGKFIMKSEPYIMWLVSRAVNDAPAIPILTLYSYHSCLCHLNIPNPIRRTFAEELRLLYHQADLNVGATVGSMSALIRLGPHG